MIPRYSTPEMDKIWSQESRFLTLLKVEQAVAKVQGDKGLIPKKAAVAISQVNQVNVKDINRLEKTLRHDVIAFVQSVAKSIGPEGRFLHFGLTSSDVLDTALSLQIKKGGELILSDLELLKKEMIRLVEENKDSLCPGRTHGMWAEPTTFSLKMAGYLAELNRNTQRVQTALKINEICKLSGAVGTYSFLDPEIEKEVAHKLGLKPETVATQVVPRDRQAELFLSFSLLLTGYERLAVELRHLQRSEVGEVTESFLKGQKGSSAMPHKQNPISAENITGLARMVRSYSIAAMENIVLWHERDISHSSVERVFLPDAFILAHYATQRLTQLLKNLFVEKEKMKKNVDKSLGLLMSSHLLLALVDKGFSREDAYEVVQSLSFQAKAENKNLQDIFLQSDKWAKVLSNKELESIFSGQRHLRNQNKILKRVLRV